MNGPEALDLVRHVKGLKDVSRETEARLTVFHDLLQLWQKRVNLISASTIDHIWERHIVDSLQCCAAVPDGRSIVDIGSGAGFPGLVMAIVLAEDVNQLGGCVNFIESNGKKCAFINAVIRETGLKSSGLELHVHHGRIEEILPSLEVPDVVSARALAPLVKLLELTKPFLQKGCIGLFPKGRDHTEEIKVAQLHWEFQLEKIPSVLEKDSILLKVSHLKQII